MLTKAFKEKAFKLLETYQSQGMPVVNQGKIYSFREFDERRMEGIPELNELLQKFFNASINLTEFKEAHELLCRKHNYWGMSSFSGQMFLNQMTIWSNASSEVTVLLRKAFKAPEERLVCAEIIDEVTHSLPRFIPRKGIRLASVPTLLSYFWQIQNPGKFPLFHTSARDVLQENELQDEGRAPGRQYLDYWEISDELFLLFSQKIDLKGVNQHWFVEHVLWTEHRKILTSVKDTKKSKSFELSRQKSELWREFLPAILNDFEKLALGKDSMQFERKVLLLFKMLGFQVEGIGQGRGREPDGIARWSEAHYAILLDAKSSSDGFSLGTSDRAIIEYINKYEQKLRREGFRAIYFVLISGAFKGNSNQAIMNIRKESSVRSVVLMTAEQALRVLARRIKEPFTFGLEALEDLLFENGPISDDKLAEFLDA